MSDTTNLAPRRIAWCCHLANLIVWFHSYFLSIWKFHHNSYNCFYGAQYWYRHSVHQSVCPSVTYLSHFLQHMVAQSFKFSQHQIYLQNSDGSTPMRSWNTNGVYKFHDFLPVSGYIWETIQYRAVVILSNRDITDDLYWPLRLWRSFQWPE